MSIRFDLDSFLHSGAILQSSSNTLLIGYGQQQWLPSPSSTQPHFYFPHFFLNHSPNQSPWLFYKHSIELPIHSFLKLLPAPTSIPSIQWQNPDNHFFRLTFNQLHLLFTNHILTKAVPYLFLKSDFTPSPSLILHCLSHALNCTQKYPLHLYGFWNKEEGLLGTTPEILFDFNRHTKLFHTMACAGTALSKESHHLFRPKEQQEHEIVIKGIRQALQPYATLQQAKQKVILLGRLAHLVTPLFSSLHDKISFDTIVSALHPTPALGAFPKKAGDAWLCDYEKQMPRRRFGAPVGFITEKEMRCFVAIRNMQWSHEGTKIGAGSGIIAESNFDEEWQEIQAKMAWIREIFHL